VPTEYVTDVFADVSDGQLVVAMTLNRIGQRGKRFALYRSAKDDLTQWTLLGSYWGEIRASAVRGSELWAFFDGGILRRYRLAEDPEDGVEHADGVVERLPFEWETKAACVHEGEIWAVGIGADDRIVVARNAPQHALGWQLIFPPGPVAYALRGEGGEADAAEERGRDARRRLLLPRIRAYAGGDLFVFWSVAQHSDGIAHRIHGARLMLTDREGVYWKALPACTIEHEDFCAAPGAGGAPGLVVREPSPSHTRKSRRELLRTELDESLRGWKLPYAVTAANAPLLFMYIPGCAWVRWDQGELLVRSDTQRLELMRHEDGRWAVVEPPDVSWLMLHLAEVQVMVLFGGAVFLVVAGSVAFAVVFVRLKQSGHVRPFAHRAPGMIPAPVGARVIAALMDLVLVSGIVLAVAGWPTPPADPLVPGLRPLMPHTLVIAALVVYCTVLEAWLGATLGKLAMGLRVAGPDGRRPGCAQAFVRNLLRLVDMFPPPTGAVGLGMMALSGSRRRLGDMAARTTVVATPGPRDPLSA
jgi:uncharacterized RDD family membrane protein YckC